MNLIRSFKKPGEHESLASVSILKIDYKDIEIANDSSKNAINDGIKVRSHFASRKIPPIPYFFGQRIFLVWEIFCYLIVRLGRFMLGGTKIFFLN